jgi:hypothetical protein
MATPRVALPTAIVALVLMFAPTKWLLPFGLDSVRDSWRVELGLALLVAMAVLVAHAAFALGGPIGRTLKARSQSAIASRHLDGLKEILHSLTPDEKAVLLPYLKEKKTSVPFDVGDGVVGGLAARDILFRSASIGDGFNFPFNLQPWAREYLEAHPELLDGASPRRKARHWMSR